MKDILKLLMVLMEGALLVADVMRPSGCSCVVPADTTTVESTRGTMFTALDMPDSWYANAVARAWDGMGNQTMKRRMLHTKERVSQAEALRGKALIKEEARIKMHRRARPHLKDQQ